MRGGKLLGGRGGPRDRPVGETTRYQLEKGMQDSWVDSGGSFTVGTALEMEALEEAGIERADAFVASTDGDNTNLVIAQIAKKRFNIKTVVVRVLDPARATWYEQQGLRTVCPTKIAIEMLEEAVLKAVAEPGTWWWWAPARSAGTSRAS